MAYAPQQQGSGKDLNVFRKLPRSPVGSYLFKAAGEQQIAYHYMLAAFTPSVLRQWITQYLRNRWGSKHVFKSYQDPSQDRGIYQLGDESLIGGQGDPNGEIRVSLAGDWGTGTDEAAEVAQCITQWAPHYTIHLGDIYYVGDKTEVQENCLGIPDPKQRFTPGLWPVGSVGSFALNGNHEMYALGKAYFDLFLPKLGVRAAPGAAPVGQAASFFCLQNDHWTIIGLDTGYNSISIPILEYIFHPSCKLPDELLNWIQEQVKPKANKRGILLLSHHQYYSMFDEQYPKPAEQLLQLIDRPVLWFWGHEHRLAIYGKYKTNGGVEAYGRCIGHGGMPVDRDPAQASPKWPLVLYDNRRYPSPEKITAGYNGFANLTFRGNQLTIEYRDLKNTQLLTERWEVNNGVLTGKEIHLVSQDPALKYDPDLTGAIR
jgi:Calcineurin-like phosphoesterase